MIANLDTLARYHAFIRFMAARRRKGSIYKTLLGQGWLVVNPLAQMLIYYFLIVIVFDRSGASGIHPFIMIMTGLAHYLFFQQSLVASCHAITGNESLLMQIAIEPIVFTAISFYQSIQDLLVLLVLFLLFYLYLGPAPTWSVLAYPVCLIGLLGLGWSWSVILSSLTVFFRDLAQLSGITLRMLLYLSPVVYLIEFIPEERWGLPLREIYLYNPIGCLFAMFQWSLLGTPLPSRGPIIALAVFVVGSFIAAQLIYGRVRHKFTKVF